MSDNKDKQCIYRFETIRCNKNIIDNIRFCDEHKNNCRFFNRGKHCKEYYINNTPFCKTHQNRCIYTTKINGLMCSKNVEKNGGISCKTHNREQVCKWKLLNGNNCSAKVIEGTNGCLAHNGLYLKWDNIPIENFIRCYRCFNYVLIPEDIYKNLDKNKINELRIQCDTCNISAANYRKNKKEKSKICENINSNGKKCTFKITDDKTYYKIILNATKKLQFLSKYKNPNKYCGIHIVPELIREHDLNNNIKRCNMNGCYNEVFTEINSCRKCNIINKFNDTARYCSSLNPPREFKLSFEKCSELYESDCFYCDKKPIDSLNGIDRVDNNIGYTLSNIVSCCIQCNKMKNTMTLHDFYYRCLHIYSYNSLKMYAECNIDDECIDELEQNLNYTLFKFKNNDNDNIYNTYKYRAGRKEIKFELSIKEFNNIISNGCYYCGLESNINNGGVDRIDSSKSYNIDNCVSCCYICNLLKNEYSIESFIDICGKISTNQKIMKILNIT